MWAGTLLDRLVLGEAARLTLLYTLGLQALLLLPLAIPLLREGAPLGALLTLAPLQAAFLAPITLPLGLVAAIVATLTRIREDGELTALRASGCSPLRLAAGLLPLVALVMALDAILVFSAMPASMKMLRQRQTEILGQALSTKVARQEPLFQQRTYALSPLPEAQKPIKEATTVTGLVADGQHLDGVFILRQEASGQRWVAYAPAGLWARGSASAAMHLVTLALDEVRVLGTTGTPVKDADFAQLHRSADTSASAAAAAVLADVQARMAGRNDDTTSHSASSGRQPWPMTAALLPRWTLRLPLPLGAGGDNLDALSIGALVTEAATRAFAVRQVERILASTFAPQEAALAVLAQGAIPGSATATAVQRRSIELQLMKRDSGSHLVNARRDQQRVLLALHQRFALPASILLVGLLAVGLGLTVPVRSRLAAVLLGLLGTSLAIFPGMAVVKGVGGHLGVHPALLVWGPLLFLGAVGAWLAWRSSR
jgi:lipopolysaccharide export LptBFGC system permease protein LptF